MAIKKSNTLKEEPTLELDTVDEVVEENLFVRLAKASTYVHSDGVTFTKEDIYEVSKNRGAELLAEIAPSGIPMFISVKDPDSAKKSKKIAVKSLDPKEDLDEVGLGKVSDSVADSKITIVHSEEDTSKKEDSFEIDENGEFDTGAVALLDEEGNTIGVTI